ncbi:Adenosine deaminase [Fusarium austroafricanum]|uniref:Adenosine deaminase n=1 Tax=Fusarium austroafricanum TaxID=2364996 RepID=A0A8H4KCZ4_9HYPO|nr:Adenosine deaminase [Fusarium austroafricanum]
MNGLTISPFVAALPKIELHIHIEGTLQPALRWKLARRNNVALRWRDRVYQTYEELLESYQVTYNHRPELGGPKNVPAFLEAYFAGCEVLLKEEDFYELAMEYLARCQEMNVRYTEPFFDIQAHTRRGVKAEDVLNGYLRAQNDAAAKFGVHSNWILCFIRDEPVEEGEAAYEAARPWARIEGGKGLFHAVGLASNAYERPPNLFKNTFAKARKDGLHITTHCDFGQKDTHEHIRQAIFDIGIERIDHGLDILDKDELVEGLLRKNIVFLVLHILLAVFVIVDCWYHIYYWKPLSGIYELWIYMVCAVCAFDRFIRVLRVAKNGTRRANIVEISDEIVRIDISGVRWLSAPGYHAYIYFPTLEPLRAWQNHPFSVTNSALLRKTSVWPQISPHLNDVEISQKSSQIAISQSSPGIDSISLYIKKHGGTTRILQERSDLPVLLEDPYCGNLSRDVLKCDRILLIGGGIGIPGLLSWTHAHVNVKLAWSMKESYRPLLQDLEPALSTATDKLVLVGEWLDVESLLEHEVEAGWKKVGVVACGPAGLCDLTRAAVSKIGKVNSVAFELEVDAFA